MNEQEPELTTPTDPPAQTENDLAAVQRLADAYRQMTAELGKVIVGQHAVIEELMIALLSGGHCLLLGRAGVGENLDGPHPGRRDEPVVQPDSIHPRPDARRHHRDRSHSGRQADRAREFRFLEGPIFANVVLADEINRTPPKTQAALLEAMQEHQVTAGGKRHALPDLFFVLATQNPIEQEGTYPLPEAQLDRFMFEILVDYPDEEEEFQIVRQTTADIKHSVEEVLSHERVELLQQVVRRVPVADHVIRYAMQFSRLTRREKGGVPEFIQQFVSWGAGPRASQYLVLGAKARAMLHGRTYASSEDVRAVAKPVLRHRIITNFNAEAEGITADDIIDRLIKEIPVPSDTAPVRSVGSLPKMFGAD